MILFDDKIVQIQTVEFYSRNGSLLFFTCIYRYYNVFVSVLVFS